jgi:hypothetical protein
MMLEGNAEGGKFLTAQHDSTQKGSQYIVKKKHTYA